MIHRSEVSMISEARDAQWTPETFLGPGSVLAIAPAKMNLLLAVGARGDDGYHEVTTVLHALALNDRIFFHRGFWDGETDDARIVPTDGENDGRFGLAGPSDNLLISIDIVDRVNPEPLAVDVSSNIIGRAFDALARRLSYDRRERIDVHLEKHIPVEAGLGGGSSDGAAALRVAARWWGIPDDDPRLDEVANEIGCDVAFFLRGGCGVYGGQGGDFLRALKPATSTIVLVKPPEGVSTAQAYRAFDENPSPFPPDVRARLEEARAAADIPLFNNLESAAFRVCEPLREMRCWLDRQPGVTDALLCGSGSAVGAFLTDLNAANALASAASARGCWSRVTTLAPWGVVLKDA